jgi:multidrug efflux pump subunit AcrB
VRLQGPAQRSSAFAAAVEVDIDRDKAQALGLNMNNVFTALQSTLGGFFVNNFNLYGRTWQVNIEGEAKNRRELDDIWQIHVRSKDGEMVPMRSIANLRFVVGPQVITRYNNRRSITINRKSRTGRVVRRRACRHAGDIREDPAAGLRF